MNFVHLCVKYVFWSANTLCLIFGLFTALICALFMDSIHNLHLSYCLLGFAVGLITFVVTLCGCRGVKLSSPSLLWLYSALLLILFGTQVYIAEHFHTRSIVDTSVQEVQELWTEELHRPGAMATIERQFKCCGLHSYTDYGIAKLHMPPSCYYNDHAIWLHYTEGCLEIVKFAACRASTTLKIVSTTLTIVQLIALVFGCILASIFRRNATYETVL